MKKVIIFQEMELTCLRLKNLYFVKCIFLIFSQKSFCYISRNGTFLKNFFYFRRQLSKLKKKKISEKISYISGNGTFWTQNLNKTFLYLLEITCLMVLDCRNNVQVQSPVTLMPHGEKIEATGPLR